MSFTFQSIPNPTDLLSVSQGDLLNNAKYFQGTLNKDHKVAFGDSNTTTSEGRHRQVGYIGASSANPGYIADGTDSMEFSFGGNIYYQSQAMATASVAPVQLTNANYNGTFAANPGYTFLPGAILLQWGSFTSSTAPVTTSFPISFGTAYQVVCVSSNTLALPVVTALGTTTFTVTYNNPSANPTIRWIAVGVK